jgi:hypothetical protein
MAIDVPRPRNLMDVFQGINALSKSSIDNRKSELENAMQKIKNQYAPVTVPAEAASKLAYANLMGPQFLAKMMGNEGIVANMPESQKKSALELLNRAATGQGTGNSVFNQLSQPKDQPDNSLLSIVGNKLKNIFSGQTPEQAQSPKNALLNNEQPNLSQQDQQNIENMQPGEAYTIQGNEPNAQPKMQQEQNPSYAENTGTYKGIVQEGKESGKIRANDIKELNDAVFNGQTKQTTFDSISNLLSSPEFEQIRQVPLAGHHELSYYSKFGTPEQQNMVGQYYTLTGNIIKDSARDFAGQFRKGEQQLLQGMKPNPSDTVDVARGKTESLAVMNKLLTERSRLTSEIMSKYHVNKLQAQEEADKQVNGDLIRQNIHEKLNPTITIRNKKTGEVVTVPIKEARKRGVLNV